MRIPVTEEFRNICRSICAEARSEETWSLVESDDLIQTDNFEGGYDTTERAFCFSFYDDQRSEFWFQVTLAEVNQIAAGEDVTLVGRAPE